MADIALRRHDLVHIVPKAWRAVIAGHDVAAVADWAERGRPTIARRHACGDAAGALPLGLPLPLEMGRLRLALCCPADAIARVSPPPLLVEAAPAAPASWQATIAALLRLQPGLRCFGSLAWQSLTGLAYLTETSDLDLILTCATAQEADIAGGQLAEISAIAPMRIDAELIAPSGEAVHWREWQSGEPTLLAKSLAGAKLRTREMLFP